MQGIWKSTERPMNILAAIVTDQRKAWGTNTGDVVQPAEPLAGLEQIMK